MRRAHILVEGQTEEAFVNKVLVPHLTAFAVYLTPVLVVTKRVKSGMRFKGGIRSYAPVRLQLRTLLRDSSASAVTTMIDFYGVPADFPGRSELRPESDCYGKVQVLEDALRRDLADPRLLPYLSLHEFEALVLVSPEALEHTFPSTPFADKIRASMPYRRSPEEINDGPSTHPSRRLMGLIPSYRKVIHGPLVATRIGLTALRESCPHFDRWVTALEDLGTKREER